MVEHLHILYDDVEDIKFLGIFSTKEKAEKAIQMLSKQPGFKDFPKIIDDNDIENDVIEGFYIIKVVVDEIAEWKEGFTTVKWKE
jgi:homoserine kinase